MNCLKKSFRDLRSDIFSGQKCLETVLGKSISTCNDRINELFKLLQEQKDFILKRQVAIDQFQIEDSELRKSLKQVIQQCDDLERYSWHNAVEI